MVARDATQEVSPRRCGCQVHTRLRALDAWSAEASRFLDVCICQATPIVARSGIPERLDLQPSVVVAARLCGDLFESHGQQEHAGAQPKTGQGTLHVGDSSHVRRVTPHFESPPWVGRFVIHHLDDLNGAAQAHDHRTLTGQSAEEPRSHAKNMQKSTE